MSVLSSTAFLKQNILQNDTMNESYLQRVNKYSIYPGDSKLYPDNGFVNFDIGSMGGAHWTCFLIKDSKSFYFDSFGRQPGNFLLKQLTKPIKYDNYKIRYDF